MPYFIHTASGKRFTYGSHDTEVLIEDVAKHLSCNARFSGATKFHFSVGQHSVNVVPILRKVFGVSDPRTLLHGLLHDAHEYVMNDAPTPFQEWVRDEISGGVDFIEIAKSRLDAIIMPKLGVSWPPSKADAEVVKLADKAAFVIEAGKLFHKVPDWLDGYKRRYNFPSNLESIDIPVTPMLPSEAEHLFLKTYRELKDAIDAEINNRAFEVPARSAV